MHVCMYSQHTRDLRNDSFVLGKTMKLKVSPKLPCTDQCYVVKALTTMMRQKATKVKNVFCAVHAIGKKVKK